MNIMGQDTVKLISFLCCLVIIPVSIFRWKKTGIRAFLFIAASFTFYGLSWFLQLFVGIDGGMIIGVRTLAYISLMIGLVL